MVYVWAVATLCGLYSRTGRGAVLSNIIQVDYNDLSGILEPRL